MERQPEEEMDGIMQEIAQDLGYNWKEKSAPRAPTSPLRPRVDRNAALLLIASSAVLLASAVLVFLAFRGPTSGKTPDEFRKAVGELQERMDRLEGAPGETQKLNEQVRGLLASVERLRQSAAALDQGLGKLASRVDQAEKKGAQPHAQAAVKANSSARKEPGSEGRHYVVQPGDTLIGIAKRHNITAEDLCLLNRLSITDIIHPGQRLIVARGRP